MHSPNKLWSRWVLPALVLCSFVGCDQWTKKLASDHLRRLPPMSFLGDTLRIQYAENPGAFLGAGSGLSEQARFWVLIVVNAGFLVAITVLVVLRRISSRVQILAVALLLSGGIGNLIDRVFHRGLVVDFLNLGVGPLRTGIFNVADVAIMAGFGLLIAYRLPAEQDPRRAAPRRALKSSFDRIAPVAIERRFCLPQNCWVTEPSLLRSFAMTVCRGFCCSLLLLTCAATAAADPSPINPVAGNSVPETRPSANRPSYVIHRTGTPIVIDGRLDEPAWFAAPSVGPFRFAWWTSGKQEQTVAKMLWDDENLYVAYICQDAHISAVRKRRDSDVWLDDCVEVFAAPDPGRPNAYFNIEMNVNGAVYDDFHPHGPGSGAKPNWNAAGLRIATRVEGTLNNDSDRDKLWTLEVAIPFPAYAPVPRHVPPQPGDVWRLNLNRCGGKTNEQFSQWASGTTAKPQFHSPRDFGFVTFSAQSVPF